MTERLPDLADFTARVFARYMEPSTPLSDLVFRKIAENGKTALISLTAQEIEALPVAFLLHYEPELVTRAWFGLPATLTSRPDFAPLAPCLAHYNIGTDHIDGPAPAKRNCSTCRLHELYHPTQRKPARKTSAKPRQQPAEPVSEVNQLIFNTLQDDCM